MQQVQREKVAATSGDVVEQQLAKLRGLFPEAVVEGKIDFDRLRATLGAAAETGPGRFSFTWAGKEDAIALLQTPSRGTLVPCPEESVNFETTGHVFIEGDNLEVLKLLSWATGSSRWTSPSTITSSSSPTPNGSSWRS
jgi:adenine-specific DNA-methyltransferase